MSPSQKFEYDALYRLVKATGREHVSVNADGEPEAEGYNAAQISPQDGSAMRNYSREWEYDSVGNILSMIHKFNGSQWTRRNAYATDSNRLNSTAVGQTAASFAYNAHGSMTSMPHLSAMDWDFAEKLCHVTRGTTEAYYNYDGSGIRTRKVVEKNGVVETRLYLGGFEIWRKTVNGVLDTERETLHVMDDQRRIAIVETLTVENGNRVAAPAPVQRYQLDNHLGSASLELDGSANVISYEEYYPYGDTSYRAGRNASEVSRKRYRYTGKEKDEESSLYYCEQRYYAAHISRWVSTDSTWLADGINLYAYVHGNPLSGVDPSGTGTEDLNYNYEAYPKTDEVDNQPMVFRNDENKANDAVSYEKTGKQIQSTKSEEKEISEFNKGVNSKKMIEDLTSIILAKDEKNLTDSQKKIKKNIPDFKEYAELARVAYDFGELYLTFPLNQDQVEAFYQLSIQTTNDPQKNEFYFTGQVGKTEDLNPKIGVISNGGYRSVQPNYDSDDYVIFHSHPDECPLSYNGLNIKDVSGKNYVLNREGDLGASAESGNNLFVITPKGDIYFTTPELAEFGITHSTMSSTFFGTGMLGQVYLGNISQYTRSMGRKK